MERWSRPPVYLLVMRFHPNSCEARCDRAGPVVDTVLSPGMNTVDIRLVRRQCLGQDGGGECLWHGAAVNNSLGDGRDPGPEGQDCVANTLNTACRKVDAIRVVVYQALLCPPACQLR